MTWDPSEFYRFQQEDFIPCPECGNNVLILKVITPEYIEVKVEEGKLVATQKRKPCDDIELEFQLKCKKCEQVVEEW